MDPQDVARVEVARPEGEEDWDTTMAPFNPYTDLKRQVLDKLQQVTRTLHEAGGMVIGGTDTPGLGYPPAGFALLREMEMLADVMGTMDTIRAVTSQAAKHVRRDSDLGAVAPGRLADFLVIDGDPLRDIRELRRLETVYRGGRAFDAHDLLARVPQHPGQ